MLSPLQKIKLRNDEIKNGSNQPRILGIDYLVGKIKELEDGLKKLKEIETEVKDTASNEVKKYKEYYRDVSKDIEDILAYAKEVLSKVQKGDKGDNYVLTEKDIEYIASLVEVPIVEKIVEKTVVEKPIIKETINNIENKFTLDNLLEFLKKLPKDILKIENIKGLQGELRQIASKATGVGMRGGQGSWKQTNLSGDINSVNTIFTFSGEDPAQYSERVFLNYIEQNPFTDYTINYKTKTITYTVAPDVSLSGLPHIIRYM